MNNNNGFLVKTPAGNVASEAANNTLGRGLSQRHVELIAIGGCIGTGLFLGSGTTISLAGPAIIIIYALTGMMLYFVMRAMGELLLYDLSYKSFVDFSEDILGPFAGYLVGWSYWFAWIIAAIAEVIAITGYLNFWWPGMPHWAVACLAITLLFAINMLAVRAFGELEFWLAIIKVVAIMSLIIIGGWLIWHHDQDVKGNVARVSNLWQFGGFFPMGLEGMLRGLQTTIFAFAGMEIIGTMMAEAKNPTHMIPKAIRAIPFRIMLFYIGTVTILMMVTPWQQIPASTSPFVSIFSMAGLLGAAGLINFVVLSSAISSSNSGVFATSRMLYGLAKHHNAPALFGRLSSHKIPSRAVMLAGALMIMTSLVLTLTESVIEGFRIVASVSALLFIFVWSMILIAYLVHQRRHPEARAASPFPMPCSQWAPYMVLIFFAVTLYALTLDQSTRLALMTIPGWFMVLAAGFYIKTHQRPYV
jgi:D-serine/D-alanine/glycine transporter